MKNRISIKLMKAITIVLCSLVFNASPAYAHPPSELVGIVMISPLIAFIAGTLLLFYIVKNEIKDIGYFYIILFSSTQAFICLCTLLILAKNFQEDNLASLMLKSFTVSTIFYVFFANKIISIYKVSHEKGNITTIIVSILMASVIPLFFAIIILAGYLYFIT